MHWEKILPQPCSLFLTDTQANRKNNSSHAINPFGFVATANPAAKAAIINHRPRSFSQRQPRMQKRAAVVKNVVPRPTKAQWLKRSPDGREMKKKNPSKP